MDQKQFDALLSDAETRLRRLKVLYEQWFMGIERVEPGLARKEFEDLLAHMRKQQPNNTAQRFRLQQLVQRHIALATYWRRVGRQIEEGTFQRDVLRAKRRKQQGGQARDADEPDLDVTYDVEVDEDLAEALAEADRLAQEPPPPSPPTQYAAQAGKRGRTVAGVGPPLPLTAAESVRPPLQPDAAPTSHSLSPFAVPGADGLRSRHPTPSTPPAAPAPLIKQPLTAAGAGRGAPSPTPAGPPARGRAPTPPGTRAGPPAPPGELLGAVASGGMSAPHATTKPNPGAAGPKAGAPGGGAALPGIPAALGGVGRGLSTPQGAAAVAARNSAAGPQLGSAAGRASVVGAAAAPTRTAAAPGAASTARNSAAADPQLGAAANRASVPGAAGRPVPSAAAARVSPAQVPPVAPRASKAAAPAAQSGAAISAQDIDRVYNQYVAARGRNAERTDNVKRETIEKTIRGMLPQLEQKHAGKKIDFEVVVKDGRVALKPVAK